MARKKAPDWDKIESEYKAGATAIALATKHKVPQTTIESKASRNKWGKDRKSVASIVQAQAPETIARARIEAIATTAADITKQQVADLQWLWGQMIEQAKRLVEIEMTREVATKAGPMEIAIGAMDRLHGLKQAASAAKEMQASIRKALGVEDESGGSVGTGATPAESKPLDQMDDTELTQYINDQIAGR